MSIEGDKAKKNLEVIMKELERPDISNNRREVFEYLCQENLTVIKDEVPTEHPKYQAAWLAYKDKHYGPILIDKGVN